MANYRPYLTDDGSIGLFSGDYDDIFHSRYGALTEAYEKFVLPANIANLLRTKQEINVLDICYGIGYNTKAFLNESLKYYFENNFNCFDNNIGSIHSDKIKEQLSLLYNDSICTDKNCDTQNEVFENEGLEKPSVKNYDKINGCNFSDNFKSETNTIKEICFHKEKDVLKKTAEPFPSINIDALEFEKEFIFLSPFVKEMSFNARYKLSPIITNVILKNLYEQYGEGFVKRVKNLNVIKEYSKFFNKSMFKQVKNIHINGYNYTQTSNKNALLHNIYYQNISKRTSGTNSLLPHWCYWYVSKRERNLLESFDDFIYNIKIKFFTDDARNEVAKLDKKYNLVFLDAFTPSKLPTLWSVEFFEKIFNLIDNDGVLFTYTSSARVRKALLDVGFYIGVIKSRDGHFVGTVASKNPNNIIHSLSDKEFGLLDTKAGIPYRDSNLNNTSEAILEDLRHEIEKSDKQSSSQYLKGVTNEI